MPTIVHLTPEYAQKTNLLQIQRNFGDKALGIATLQQVAGKFGFSVPRTWAISHEVYNRFLIENNLSDQVIGQIYAENSRKTVSTPTKRTLTVIGGGSDLDNIFNKHIAPKFQNAKFPAEDETELRDALNLINQSQLPLKMKVDQSGPIYANAQEMDFQRFSHILKGLYARTLAPSFWLAVGKGDRSISYNGIIIQEVPGNYYLIRGKELFFPVYSGITAIDPYSPVTMISYRNLGLSSGKNHGDFFDKVASTIDPEGKEGCSFLGSKPIPKKWRIACLENDIRRKVATINPINFLMERNMEEELEFTFMKADSIAQKFYKRYGSLFEIEWSFDESRLYLHHIAYSEDKFSESYTDYIKIKDAEQESVIAQSRSICGHGELKLRLIVPQIEEYGKSAEIQRKISIFGGAINALRQGWGSGYILAVDIVEALKDKEISDIMHSLAGMSGVINLSDQPLPLATPWADWFRENNILVISKKDVDWSLLEKVCDVKKTLFQYSSKPVRMAVDQVSKRGQVHLL